MTLFGGDFISGLERDAAGIYTFPFLVNHAEKVPAGEGTTAKGAAEKGNTNDLSCSLQKGSLVVYRL